MRAAAGRPPGAGDLEAERGAADMLETPGKRRARRGERRNILRRQFERIPARDHVFLSTWEKWRLYRRIPWKLVLHVALLALTTWQIVHINSRDAAYVRAAKRNFYYYFFPQEFDFDERRFFLYTVDEAHGSVLRAVTNFRRITTSSVDQISHPANEAFCLARGHCHDGRLDVLRFGDHADEDADHDGARVEREHTWTMTRTRRETFYVNEHDLGPLSKKHPENRLAAYLRSVVRMQLTLRLQTRGPAGSGRECLVWEIRLLYSFEQRGQLILTLQSAVVYDCAPPPTATELLHRPVHLIDLIVVALSMWTLALSARSVWLSWRLLRRAERAIAGEDFVTPARRSDIVASLLQDADANAGREEFDTPLLAAEFGAMLEASSQSGGEAPPGRIRALRDDQIPDLAQGKLRFAWRDRLRFFNFWFVLASLAALLNIAQAIARLVRTNGYAPLSTTDKCIAGLGCALLWVNSVSFLAHKPQYFTIVLTLSRALPRVARFLMGVLPILLAYALFGMVYFGDHVERFGSFGDSMITLFSVLNGDVIRETFMDVVADYPVVTQVYLYTFISLFMYVVLNVFIAIVEESFFSTRASARSLETFAKQVRGAQDAHDREGATGASAVHSASDTGPPRSNTLLLANAGRFASSSDSAEPLQGQCEEEVLEQRKLAWLHGVLDSLED